MDETVKSLREDVASLKNTLQEIQKKHNIPDDVMDYVLTYKMSQDHIELFFGLVRSKLGCNNNPNVVEFKRIYRKLLCGVSNNNLSRCSNVTQQDQTESVDIFQNNDETLSYLSQKYDLEVNDELETCLEVTVNSEFKSGVLEYIAGYVGFKLAQKIDCQECLMLLKSEKKTPAIQSLISAKDKGGLFKPKSDLAKVCEVSEKVVLEYIDQKQILNTCLTRLTCKIVTCLITQGSFPNQHQCALFVFKTKYAYDI